MKNFNEIKDLIKERSSHLKYDSMRVSSNKDLIRKYNQEKVSDPWNNELHLSAFSGLLNDPNGLVYDGISYHIFYQWSPFIATHKLKHWGHFLTPDFINYTHTGAAIEPDTENEKNGVYSGGAYAQDGDIHLFWTGNVRQGDSRTAFTLTGKLDQSYKVSDKKVLFEVDKSKYTGHFRDPRPLKIDNRYYLLHGAQRKDAKGQISVYDSKYIDHDYELKGDIIFEPQIRNGYMLECPDFITIDGTDYLLFSIQGENFFGKQNQNNDLSGYLKGKMDWNSRVFAHDGEICFFDYGFDFYAPQIVSNADSNILIGWVGVPGIEQEATFLNNWAHNLAIPRVLEKGENGKLIQKIIPQYKNLRHKEFLIKQKTSLENRLVEIDFKTIEGDFALKLEGNHNHDFRMQFKNGKLTFHRDNMEIEQAPQFGLSRSVDLEKLSSMKVVIDNSLIEFYINDGAFAFTSKYFLEGNINLVIDGNYKVKGYYLKSINVRWNV